jgi:hypothetical protein
MGWLRELSEHRDQGSCVSVLRYIHCGSTYHSVTVQHLCVLFKPNIYAMSDFSSFVTAFEFSGDWGFNSPSSSINPSELGGPRIHGGRFQPYTLFEGNAHANNKFFSLLVYSMYVCTDGIVT